MAHSTDYMHVLPVIVSTAYGLDVIRVGELGNKSIKAWHSSEDVFDWDPVQY